MRDRRTIGVWPVASRMESRICSDIGRTVHRRAPGPRRYGASNGSASAAPWVAITRA